MVIPLPTNLFQKDGWFLLSASTVLGCDPENRENAAYLQNLLQPATGYPFPIVEHNLNTDYAINLILGPRSSNLGAEGYRLSISPAGVSISAETSAGVFYAIQTLRQLLPPEIEAGQTATQIEWKLPCLEIEDRPQFAWRGYMLDEGRHFQGVDTVKKLLDQMAMLKLNRFHWHLTDDQGWRIEIKRYPRLTEIGSTRPGTVTGNPYFSKSHDHLPHQGFYTQDQIREIVAYADQRHIMVIPEIELPGHCSAALAAYPELGCSGGPYQVQTGFGIFKDILCAGKAGTTTFLENVLAEVFTLFPAPYLHLGGDEAPKKRWKSCPDCQRRIQQAGLADERSLQVAFTNDLAAFCTAHGRTAILWSDSFRPEIDQSAVIQFWIGNRKALFQAMHAGRQVINSSYLYTYLDHSYPLLPLRKTYQFDPIFEGLDSTSSNNLLGLEGLMWGEWLPNHRRVEFQTFPRLIALAETGWSTNRQEYPHFSTRLKPFLTRLDLRDVGYASLRTSQPSISKRIFGLASIAFAKSGISKPVKEELP